MTDVEPDIVEPDDDEPDELAEELEDLADDLDAMDDALTAAHLIEPDRRRQRRIDAARERIAELVAMKQLAALGVATRSRRQATHPDLRIANLPWVGDVAEHHGIQL